MRRRLSKTERAWYNFCRAMYGEMIPHPRLSKRRRKNVRRHDEIYWRLIRSMKMLGIKIVERDCLGTSTDYHGETFSVGGIYHWRGVSPTVEVTTRHFTLLSHEFAHAVDDLCGNIYTRISGELVACAAGYIFSCVNWCAHSPMDEVQYAKRQGATAAEIDLLKDRIFKVVADMQSVMD